MVFAENDVRSGIRIRKSSPFFCSRIRGTAATFLCICDVSWITSPASRPRVLIELVVSMPVVSARVVIVRTCCKRLQDRTSTSKQLRTSRWFLCCSVRRRRFRTCIAVCERFASLRRLHAPAAAVCSWCSPLEKKKKWINLSPPPNLSRPQFGTLVGSTCGDSTYGGVSCGGIVAAECAPKMLCEIF